MGVVSKKGAPSYSKFRIVKGVMLFALRISLRTVLTFTGLHKKLIFSKGIA